MPGYTVATKNYTSLLHNTGAEGARSSNHCHSEDKKVAIFLKKSQHKAKSSATSRTTGIFHVYRYLEIGQVDPYFADPFE